MSIFIQIFHVFPCGDIYSFCSTHKPGTKLNFRIHCTLLYMMSISVVMLTSKEFSPFLKTFIQKGIKTVCYLPMGSFFFVLKSRL